LSQKEQPFYGSVTVGERGQVVVPVGARKRFNVNPGDKLLVFGIPGGVGFFRVESVSRLVSSAMGRLSSMQKALAEMTSDLAAAVEPVVGDTSGDIPSGPAVGAPCGAASTAPGGASEKRAEEPSAKATGRGKKRS
jgi:AbrB family looped-hinge helix DNA binding protein